MAKGAYADHSYAVMEIKLSIARHFAEMVGGIFLIASGTANALSQCYTNQDNT